MNNNYLIPANSKKSQLILGFFTPVDLILFGSGCGLTILLLMLVRDANLTEMIIILLPALVTGFLVTPVLYYHNVLQDHQLIVHEMVFALIHDKQLLLQLQKLQL